MTKFKRGTDIKRLLFSRITLVILLFFLVLFIVNIFQMYRKSRESDQKKQNIERRIAELNEKQIDLEAKISELSTEEGIDALIREKYRVAKEGEQLVIILNEEKEIEEEGISTREGFWLKIRGIFSN